MNPHDWYCKVYLDTDDAKDSLVSMLKSFLEGEVEFSTIQNPVIEVDVNRNEDFHPSERYSDFLFYRYYLDIEPRPNTQESEYLELIGDMLDHLWEKKIPAVAACDFEARLPNTGRKQFFGD